jgi:hypothetical protein
VALAAFAAFFANDIGTVFRFMIAIGTGPGAVLILRWFWWRVNAWAELSAMLAGFVIALLTYLPELEAVGLPQLANMGFGLRLAITAGGSTAVWLPVMLLTKPESDETLDTFYARVRPAGSGWARQRSRVGLEPDSPLRRDLLRTLWAAFVLFGCMFGLGGVVLLEWRMAAFSAIAAALGLAGLLRTRRSATVTEEG